MSLEIPESVVKQAVDEYCACASNDMLDMMRAALAVGSRYERARQAEAERATEQMAADRNRADTIRRAGVQVDQYPLSGMEED